MDKFLYFINEKIDINGFYLLLNVCGRHEKFKVIKEKSNELKCYAEMEIESIKSLKEVISPGEMCNHKDIAEHIKKLGDLNFYKASYVRAAAFYFNVLAMNKCPEKIRIEVSEKL